MEPMIADSRVQLAWSVWLLIAACSGSVAIRVDNRVVQADVVQLLAYDVDAIDCTQVAEFADFASWFRGRQRAEPVAATRSDGSGGFSNWSLPEAQILILVAVGLNAECQVNGYACVAADPDPGDAVSLELAAVVPQPCELGSYCGSESTCGPLSGDAGIDAPIEAGTADGSSDSAPGSTCGDGVIEAGETCDVGGLANVGCEDCRVVEGYACEGAPSRCSPVCGDEMLVGDEECDTEQVELRLEPCDDSTSYRVTYVTCEQCESQMVLHACPNTAIPTRRFFFEEAAQAYTIPAGCYELEARAWGAAGGKTFSIEDQLGGPGGFAWARIDTLPEQVLHVLAGGPGQNSNTALERPGGFGGGGAGGASGRNSTAGASGGGRSEVSYDAEGERPIVIAGGGGGAALDGGGGAGCGSDGTPAGQGGRLGMHPDGGEAGRNVDARCMPAEPGATRIGGAGSHCSPDLSMGAGGGGGGGGAGGGGGGGGGAGGGGGGCYSVAGESFIEPGIEEGMPGGRTHPGYLPGVGLSVRFSDPGPGLVWLRCVNSGGAQTRLLDVSELETISKQ